MSKKILARVWLGSPPFLRRWGLWLMEPRFNVTVSAVVTDEQGRVLLLDHTFRAPGWGIPGGYLEKGEQPEEGLRRELREETGLEVEQIEIAFTRALRRPPQVEIVFRCHARADDLNANRLNFEIKQARWFTSNEFPPELTRTQHQIIARAIKQSEVKGI